MKAKIIKQYNDQPHFNDSNRDSFYEAIVNDSFIIRFVCCDDKNSYHLGNISILEVNKDISTPINTLKSLGLDEDLVIEALTEALSNQG